MSEQIIKKELVDEVVAYLRKNGWIVRAPTEPQDKPPTQYIKVGTAYESSKAGSEK